MTAEAGTVAPGQTQQSGQRCNLLAWLMVVGLIYLLITAVGTISAGFKSATGG
jgi:hypothetical protein